jgi:hypothetical protein
MKHVSTTALISLVYMLGIPAASSEEVLQCETIDAYNIEASKSPEQDPDQLDVKSYVSIVDDTIAINYADTHAQILNHYHTDTSPISEKVYARSFIRRPDSYVTAFVIWGDRCGQNKDETRKATWTSTYHDGSYVEMLQC